jgi:hypothetical protein
MRPLGSFTRTVAYQESIANSGRPSDETLNPSGDFSAIPVLEPAGKS